jgi:hypothetical protein
MTDLEPQEEDDPSRDLWFKSMSWLGQIRPHRRDEVWTEGLCQTFFATSVGDHIPLFEEGSFSESGCRKFQIDALGDHLCTCTSHSGAKKAHDWAVDQITDLFRTTHTQTFYIFVLICKKYVSKSRGQRCGDIELSSYLVNAAGPVPLVLDLLIAHDRFGSISDPSINGTLHYPNDIDRSLNEDATDKIRKYRADYKYRPPTSISFMPAIASKFVCLLFLQTHRETDRFFAASGVTVRMCNLTVTSSTSNAQRSSRS